MRSSDRLLASLVLAVAIGACAPTPPPVTAPAAPRHPDFVYPVVPPDGSPGRVALRIDSALASRLQQGWFRLQADDLRGADRDFTAVLKRAPEFYPATVASAYLEIARKRPREALALAAGVLARIPSYAPGLAARGEALLALHRPDEAIESFASAVAADPSLTTIGRRIEVLRFKEVQQALTDARAALAAGKTAEARAAYQHAIAESPASGVLYRELAGLERREGDLAAARAHLQKAVSLDPGDPKAQADLGEVLEEAGEYAAAVAAYRASLAAEPSDAIQARLERAEAHVRSARLPEEYRAIPDEPQITRGDLAALIGVRLDAIVGAAPRRPVTVITDIRGHWAAPWILETIRAGILDVLPNHTFQPRSRVRRGEFATILSRLLGIVLAGRPDLKDEWDRERHRITDVPPTHLMYAAVSRVVAARVLPLLPGDTFQVSRPVSGAEAIAALDRVQAIAGSSPARP